MKSLTVRQILEAVCGELLHGNPEDVINGISTDTRVVSKGEAFFALIGEQHDAHDFIPQAIDRGCSLVVLSKMPENQLLQTNNVSFLLVDNTTEALQRLAKYYLSLLSIKKIGVTGSTGKTTTKEMLFRIFSEKYKTSRNPGNFNNHIGLPLTVLSIEDDTEVGIFEMGMSEFGEIDLLAELIRPDIGIITNIGNSHIENLGSRENILKAKLEIVNYFDQDSILIINEESDLLSKEAVKGRYKVITIGNTGKSDFILSNIIDFGEEGIEFSIEYKKRNVQLSSAYTRST
jgi:UDP-N-acetylmuramoyl-tripeptide--D-alanyl-D-alanine ligase